MHETTFTLTHTAEDGRRVELPVRVRASGSFLEIMPAGYGECAAQDGHGSPVLLDLTGNGLAVHVFADINSENPASIYLEGAREECRATTTERS